MLLNNEISISLDEKFKNKCWYSGPGLVGERFNDQCPWARCQEFVKQMKADSYSSYSPRDLSCQIMSCVSDLYLDSAYRGGTFNGTFLISFKVSRKSQYFDRISHALSTLGLEELTERHSEYHLSNFQYFSSSPMTVKEFILNFETIHTVFGINNDMVRKVFYSLNFDITYYLQTLRKATGRLTENQALTALGFEQNEIKLTNFLHNIGTTEDDIYLLRLQPDPVEPQIIDANRPDPMLAQYNNAQPAQSIAESLSSDSDEEPEPYNCTPGCRIL